MCNMLVKTVYVDWDIKYIGHETSTKMKAFKRWLPEVIDKYGWCDISSRPSSGEKTHYKLVFDKPLTVFQSMIVRALLADDISRLVIDLKRCFEDEGESNRIFDQKWIDGEMKKAGEWVTVPFDIEALRRENEKYQPGSLVGHTTKNST
jgi:hypothetical protein